MRVCTIVFSQSRADHITKYLDAMLNNGWNIMNINFASVTPTVIFTRSDGGSSYCVYIEGNKPRTIEYHTVDGKRVQHAQNGLKALPYIDFTPIAKNKTPPPMPPSKAPPTKKTEPSMKAIDPGKTLDELEQEIMKDL